MNQPHLVKFFQVRYHGNPLLGKKTRGIPQVKKAPLQFHVKYSEGLPQRHVLGLCFLLLFHMTHRHIDNLNVYIDSNCCYHKIMLS